MNRNTVIGMAVVVLLGLGILWWAVLRGDDEPAPPAPTEDRPVTTRDTTGTGPALSAGSGAARLPSAPTGLRPSAPDPGLELRDHRTGVGSGSTVLEGSGAAPPAGPRLQPMTTSFVHAKMKTAMLACGAQIPVGERGAKPRIGAKLKLAAQGGVLRVTEVEPVVVDVTGGSSDSTKQCIRDALTAGEWPASGEADADGYELTLGYVVR